MWLLFTLYACMLNNYTNLWLLICNSCACVHMRDIHKEVCICAAMHIYIPPTQKHNKNEFTHVCEDTYPYTGKHLHMYFCDACASWCDVQINSCHSDNFRIRTCLNKTCLYWSVKLHYVRVRIFLNQSKYLFMINVLMVISYAV